MGDYIAGLVSVVIPTYKRSDTLRRAIDSVLGQTYPDIQVVIVNDNEIGDEFSQELYKTISCYSNNPKVIFLEQEKHINGAAARNVGIKRAEGEYLAFLDDDDYWDSRKIEHQINLLKTLDQTWGAVGCMSIHIKGNNPLFVSLPHKDGQIFKEIMQRTVGLGTGSLLMRRKAVDDTGYFDESLSRHQDIQFFAYFAFKYKIKLLKEYLYYIDHEDAANRPDVNKIKKVKKDFYISVNPLIDSLSKRDKNKFYILHDFEIGVVEWKNGFKASGLKKILRILRYPSTTFNTIRRILRRISGKKLKKMYIHKYGKSDVV